jgi:hypothetical protein
MSWEEYRSKCHHRADGTCWLVTGKPVDCSASACPTESKFAGRATSEAWRRGFQFYSLVGRKQVLAKFSTLAEAFEFVTRNGLILTLQTAELV